MTEGQPVDRLAEATGGKLHWDDPGMDEFEEGWQDFTLGKRVEVRTPINTWAKGTVVETPEINDRGIIVEADERIHDNFKFREGRGLSVMVYMNTKRGILSNIREINEEPRQVEMPQPTLKELKGKGAELLCMAEAAAEASEGRLRLVHHEQDDSEDIAYGAARFLKFDGRRLGRDIELYEFMGEGPAGWESTLPMVLEEVVFLLQNELPISYGKASQELKTIGEEVYKGEVLDAWERFFQGRNTPSAS